MLPRGRPGNSRSARVKSIVMGISPIVALLTSLALVVLPASPASATGSFDNAAIADQALTHVGQSGGQCKQFANDMVSAASNGTMSIGGGYYAPYANAGGVLESAGTAAKGDIIQLNNASDRETYYTGMHTAIVVSYQGSNTFDVVDSNWGTPLNNEIVHHHTWNPYTTTSQYGLEVNIWRLGTVSTSNYRAAFQANTGYMFTYDSPGGAADTAQGMKATTNPAVAFLTTGKYEMAFQANTGDLFVLNSDGGGGDTYQGMMAGTSPAIAAWINGGSYRVAFQANTGYLYYYDSYSGAGSTSKAMASGTSPAIAVISTNSYQMAYQGTNGDLWVYNSGGSGSDTGLPMASGTSPSIAPWVNGGSYRVAFQGSDGYLHYYDSYSGSANTGQGMKSGTSPSISRVSSGYEMAFQANTGYLVVYGDATNANTYQGMMAGTSPSIATNPSGGFRVAFQANNGYLYTYDSSGGTTNTGQGMASGTSPSIAAHS